MRKTLIKEAMISQGRLSNMILTLMAGYEKAPHVEKSILSSIYRREDLRISTSGKEEVMLTKY